MPYPCSLLTAHNNTKRVRFSCAVGRGNIVSKADVIAIIKSVIVLLVLLGQVSSLMAAPQATSLVQFDIPRQSADDSLPAFGQQADITVMYPFEDANKHITNRLYGEYTRKEGIHILLKGSGLYARFNADGHLIISSDQFRGEGMMKSKKKMLAAVVSFFVGAGGTHQVVAQNESDSAGGDGFVLEEIVVTASKRGAGTSIQDTPMAISALGGDSIEKRGLVGMDDYLRTLPGVDMQDRGAGVNSIVIRGIASDPQIDDATVGSYFGEVPISNLGGSGTNGAAGNADLKLVDIERIEVLRGPQGTIYGSGSMGGTVRVMPASPNLTETEGRLATRYSQTSERGDDNTMVQAVLNLPLIEDTFAVRGVVYRFDNSGYVDNVAGSQSGGPALDAAIAAGGVARDHGDAGSDEYTGFRLAALWQPVDVLDITLTYIQQEVEQDGQPEVNLNLSGDYQQTRLGVGANGVDRESLSNDIDIASLVANYDLGWGTVTSASSWIDYESSSESDLSIIGSPVYNAGNREIDRFTQELRLASQLDGPFQFVAGFYYEDGESDWLQTWLWSGSDPSLNPLPPGSNFFNIPDVDEIEQKAFFGELSYEILEGLTATIGARHFDYDRTTSTGFTQFEPSAPLDTIGKTSEKDTIYKANISYALNDDMLVYGQWAEGFRLGKGLPNPSPDTVCDPDNNGIIDELGITRPTKLESDTSENFELGVKSSFAENRISLNAAVYRIKWDGIPVLVTPFPLCSIQLNAGKATSEGVELEVEAALAENLRINASASYSEATLDDDTPSVGSKGDNLPGSADFNISVGLEYRFTLAEYPGFARVDYSYLSEYFSSTAEDKIDPTIQGSGDFGQLNLKTGLTINDFDVDIFVNNATNEDGFTWVESVLPAFGTARGYQIRPRTVGLNIAYRF